MIGMFGNQSGLRIAMRGGADKISTLIKCHMHGQQILFQH